MIDRRGFLASAACAAVTPALAEPLRVIAGFKGRAEGLYLPELRALQADPKMKELSLQSLAAMGDEDGALTEGIDKHRLLPLPPDCHAEDALEAIAKAAEGRQIVILNEAHHASCCRGFAEIVALRLRDEGFAVFAAETFSQNAGFGPASITLNGDAPITSNLGAYLKDPVYAEAVRSARKTKYRFACYEMRGDQRPAPDATREEQVAVREEAEANNFIADILSKDPKARVFVYCGYGHLAKAPNSKGKSWFAARLKAKTGIDPLCVSQCWMIPATDPAKDPPPLKAVLDTFAPRAPIVLRDASGEAVRFGWSKEQIDLEVIHPRLPKVDGRPGWLAAMPGRKKARYKLPEATKAYTLLQAVRSEETAAINVVPSDMYPVEAGTAEAVFFLKPGRYEVRMETDEGRKVLGPLSV